ncbi:MAG: YARHG domain-containing protein [Lachnospiraceae bacterium]|nr:YARHG domain-containing protein [Lachnospiraceae bacterium]
MDEGKISEHFSLDESQSNPGLVNTYKLDDHHAYITFYEEPESGISVQLQDHGDEYEYKYHRMAGHKLFETPSDFEKDARFTEIIRRGDVVYYDDLDYKDAILKVFLDEEGRGYNIVYDIEPGSDSDIDELIVLSMAYPEASEKTVVSEAGKRRVEESGITTADIETKYNDLFEDEQSETGFVSVGNDKSDITGDSMDYSELMDTIMIYYSHLHGTNDVDAEISNETRGSVTVRVFDPYSSSETLGYYQYDKEKDLWTDLETGDPVDFDEAEGVYEELLNGRSGYSDYILPYSSDILLTEDDLDGLTAQELTYARNEIYARHGYVFKSAELNNYFYSRDWYYPDSSFNGKLSDLEQKNANFISNYQDEYGLTYKPE